ncbi:DUF6336 family protein [Streptomyces sp. NPDC093094]|uniref:DUF6336 family protein n=1 Tax=Streptomyces sp. NPDC093094 TaxID=3366026 RepID=UPI00381663F8
MERDDEGVLAPRLRLSGVLIRGAAAGAVGAVVAAVAALTVGDHQDRMEFLAVVGGLCLIGGGFFLAVGLYFWTACAGDIRRLRDWHTVSGQHDAATVVTPVWIRLGALGLVVAPAAIGLYHLVDGAAYGSWLYSR